VLDLFRFGIVRVLKYSAFILDGTKPAASQVDDDLAGGVTIVSTD
jgi:hypothetical protein